MPRPSLNRSPRTDADGDGGALLTAPRGAAVVTGASRGLGLAIASALHRAGYAVLVTDLDGAEAAAAASRLGGWSARLDVRYEQACEVVAARAAAHPGGLALWVNNAGVLATGPSWTHDVGTRRRIMDVNAFGAMNGTLAALGVMRGQGQGHVINVVSLAGLVAVPGEAAYSASKHALLGFSLATLAELRAAGQRHVHISCLCPDGTWTPMLADRLEDPGAAASFTGVLLNPARVAARLVRLAGHPRPVVSVPAWRGVQVRLMDLFPRLSLRLTKLILATGRAGQRRQIRRLARRQLEEQIRQDALDALDATSTTRVVGVASWVNAARGRPDRGSG